MNAPGMSVSDGEPGTVSGKVSVPAVPAPVPSFREAVPTGSRLGSPFAPTGSLPPPYGGNRGPVREPQASTTGAHRRASIRVCRCHAPILAGLDGEVAAFSVAVDPYALTPAGEVEALRQSRRTYDLDQMRLSQRDRWTIPGRPPTPARPVVAEHRCGHPIPDDWKAPPPPRPATASQEVQF